MSILETDQILRIMGIDLWVKKDGEQPVLDDVSAEKYEQAEHIISSAAPMASKVPSKRMASISAHTPCYDSVTLLRDSEEATCLWLISSTSEWLSYTPKVKAFLRALLQTTIFPLPKIALGTLSLSQVDLSPGDCAGALFEQFETLGVKKVITMTPLAINDDLIVQIPALDILADDPSARKEAARILKEASVLSVF